MNYADNFEYLMSSKVMNYDEYLIFLEVMNYAENFEYLTSSKVMN